MTRAHQMAPVFVISWSVVDREYLKLQHGCRRTLDAKLKEKQVRIARTGRGLRGEWGEGGGGGKGEERSKEGEKISLNVPNSTNIILILCTA